MPRKISYLKVSVASLVITLVFVTAFNGSAETSSAATMGATGISTGASTDEIVITATHTQIPFTPTSVYQLCPPRATLAATVSSTTTFTATPTNTLEPSANLNATDLPTPIMRPGFFGIRIRPVANCGLRILSVRAGSTAQRADLQANDVIVAIDGVKTTTVTALRRLISKHQTGDELTLIIQRDGQQFDVQVLLGVSVETSPITPMATMNATGNATEDALQ